MTQVYFNNSLLVTCDFYCPTFKWIKISKRTQLKLENYGSLLLFYGAEDKRDLLM
ncbi:U exon [Bovine adenovirus 6]|uniref:U exon n=1 Tax=Bovine adenovirus 6 TaxID=111167 RepID=K9MME4_9ADEN|nr:U exon [Bovine adenovirus 6]AFV70649.1 U exon [Bovine adenovirus 6]